MKKNNSIGVYETTLKDGTPSFRASITYCGKHIALGSFPSRKDASKVYREAKRVLNRLSIDIDSYTSSMTLPFEKFVSLINYRDKGMYIANPIYLEKKIFHLLPFKR
ncbi:hypothetical protein [Butyrivibrio sp. AE3003]|uniref:hypothetical protein n=1 Tax=Butyrivibrio sp. AE3003 TaxID=1496721 RepID=UPI002E8DDDDB|nr:hypothetical protein [Butyrivibrio sp. AE3003]